MVGKANKSPKKRGEKSTRWKDPSPNKKKEPPTRANLKGNTQTNQALKHK
jgi:hypothetical protein